jgi:hypothetical protein
MSIPRAALAVLTAAALAGCAGTGATAATTTPSTGPSTTTGSATAPTSEPTVAQWCASYASLTSVLAQSSSDTASATTALAALERFDLLWGIADNLGIITSDEVAANQRSVASYRAVMTLIAAGEPRTSPQVVAATATLTAQTDADRTALSASAGRVLGVCRTASPSPSG